jgi:hypothetical protein
VPDNKPCASEREHSKLIKVTISPDYWLQLAEQYDAVAGVPPLPLIVSPRTYKLAPKEAQIAQACRQKAWVLQQYGPAEDVDEMIADVLQENAA